MVLKNKLFLQILRFITIGTLSAAVHLSLLTLLVELQLLTPLAANIFAFLTAFQVSYWGNRYWTFDSRVLHSIAAPRLLLVAGSAFLTNESLFYFFMNGLHLPYFEAQFLVLTLLPALTFTASKFWVFR